MDTALLGWIYDSSYSFVTNCSGEGGGFKLQILGKKTLQVHLIIIREWPKNNPPPILRNLDNFSPGAFYSFKIFVKERKKHKNESLFLISN